MTSGTREAPRDAARDGAHAITTELAAARAGDGAMMERLMPLVYEDLRRVAHRQLGAEAAGHTLDTTALVHETYLRLADQARARWTDRRHFFAVAAHAMRRILVDHARRHRAVRRGRGATTLPLEEARDVAAAPDAGVAASRAHELLALDEALERLAAVDGRAARVVELRFFGGLSEGEVAAILGVTARTVRRDWTRARAWLYDAVQRDAA